MDERPVLDSIGADRWKLVFLRATTFIPDLSMDDIVKNSWWRQIVGHDPDDDRIDYKSNLKVQKGSFNNNILAIISQPKRIDWTLEATVDESSENSKPPSLGTMNGRILEPFVGIVKDWFDKCSPINRLAFGAILINPTADAKTGYEEIQNYLPRVQLDPQGTSDFFYQINRPKKSSVNKNIKINRLNKWSVGLIGTVGVTIDSAEREAFTHIREQHICRLELDINTPILDSAVSGDGASAVFQELIKYGQEIASKGDVQ